MFQKVQIKENIIAYVDLKNKQERISISLLKEQGKEEMDRERI